MKTSLISVPELQIKIKSTLFRFQVEVNKVADRDRETESILLSNNLNFSHGSKKYFCINLRGQNQMSFAILLISESAVSTPVNYYCYPPVPAGTLKAAHSGSNRRGCYNIFFSGVTLATRMGSNRRRGKGPCRWGNIVYLMGRSCVYMMVHRWGNAVYRMAPFQAQKRPSAIFVRG